MARKHIILPMHIWQIEDLSVTERLVASVVYGYTEHGRPCFMTNTGLSKLLRVSRRTISTAVNSLIDKGYIEAAGGGSKRTLTWKILHGGVEAIAHPSGKNLLPVIHKNNNNLNTEVISMNEEIKEGERKPLHWQQVRDYFIQLDDQRRNQYRGHCVPWAQEFYSYYDAREWRTKQGAIDKWRPVALAWFKRSADKVPQRAVKQLDIEALQRDLKWHQRRLEGYEARGKAGLAHKEARAIHHIEQQLLQHGE